MIANFDRRTVLAATAALAASPALGRPRSGSAFPKGFLWGAATGGYQVEGNNVNNDTWLLENVTPTVFADPSGDAVNSFELWRQDLDLVRSVGLNSYRFSIEWARIEPESGQFSLAMLDDQALGPDSLCDAKRRDNYGAWLDVAKDDDFLGVQNYKRVIWDSKGKVPPPAGSPGNFSGSEVYSPSLPEAVPYAYKIAGVPIIVTEHGVGTDDDTIRSTLIPAALAELKRAMADGVPVKGYIQWSLLDSFEWIFGDNSHFGLANVDRTTFKRTAKPSAAV
jgi:beta-glucosidase/6-phospho-beta-glucosidase/beta-galactosidase